VTANGVTRVIKRPLFLIINIRLLDIVLISIFIACHEILHKVYRMAKYPILHTPVATYGHSTSKINNNIMVMFSRLIIRTFQLVFSAETVFFLIENQPEQCFNLFFNISERGQWLQDYTCVHNRC
jgi:hypothetical protein